MPWESFRCRWCWCINPSAIKEITSSILFCLFPSSSPAPTQISAVAEDGMRRRDLVARCLSPLLEISSPHLPPRPSPALHLASSACSGFQGRAFFSDGQGPEWGLCRAIRDRLTGWSSFFGVRIWFRRSKSQKRDAVCACYFPLQPDCT